MEKQKLKQNVRPIQMPPHSNAWSQWYLLPRLFVNSLFSQSAPSNSAEQMHLKFGSVSTHTPLFKHGFNCGQIEFDALTLQNNPVWRIGNQLICVSGLYLLTYMTTTAFVARRTSTPVATTNWYALSAIARTRSTRINFLIAYGWHERTCDSGWIWNLSCFQNTICRVRIIVRVWVVRVIIVRVTNIRSRPALVVFLVDISIRIIKLYIWTVASPTWSSYTLLHTLVPQKKAYQDHIPVQTFHFRIRTSYIHRILRILIYVIHCYMNASLRPYRKSTIISLKICLTLNFLTTFFSHSLLLGYEDVSLPKLASSPWSHSFITPTHIWQVLIFNCPQLSLMSTKLKLYYRILSRRSFCICGKHEWNKKKIPIILLFSQRSPLNPYEQLQPNFPLGNRTHMPPLMHGQFDGASGIKRKKMKITRPYICQFYNSFPFKTIPLKIEHYTLVFEPHY
jgi:hypothetical protein